MNNTSKRKALVVWGGWDGHEPQQVGARFQRLLESEGFEVEVSDSLEVFSDLAKLKAQNLIVPAWTMGVLEEGQDENISEAVASGVGVAGCHGGMCDAFRDSPLWQFITGGSWVSHPGNDGTSYTVNIRPGTSPLTEGIQDFSLSSEQYYLHVDPAVEVLATTRFPVAEGPHTVNGPVDIPQVWTKRWGAGRVYYNALGHHADTFDIPEVLELTRRGFLWAAGGLS